MTEREFALEVVRRLREAGFEAYWAGGCVRDESFGLAPADYDVATDARLDQVRRLFPRSKEIGATFGVVEVIGPRKNGGHHHVQVATFRADGPYTDGRRPETVVFASAYEDAQRRDFTINGMFYDPVENRLIDYVGGKDDLQAQRLRAIGDPQARFAEDKLRLLRAIRFAARFNLTIEPETAHAITEMAPQIIVVSAERIAEELRRMFTHPTRHRSLDLMDQLKLLRPIFPELEPLFSLPQSPDAPSSGTVWDHTMEVIRTLPEPVSFPLAMSALWHDVGKGAPNQSPPYPDHPIIGAAIATRSAERLRLSHAETERIAWLIEHHHDLDEVAGLRPARLKMLLNHPGYRELFALVRAHFQALGRDPTPIEVAARRRDEWEQRGELNPPPLVTGSDLKALGMTPGPEFKRILDVIRERQLDGELTNRDDALALVQRYRRGEE